MTSRPAIRPVSVEAIVDQITTLRGLRIVLDSTLAALYGVETRRLNEQVRRNANRFPPDFCFELTPEEFRNLKSQFATSSWGGRRKPPLAFTEHGSIMAAAVLSSPRAIDTSVYVVRAFVQMRKSIAANETLSKKLRELESHIESRFAQHDQAISEIIATIRGLMMPEEQPRRRSIGFVRDDD